jgi:threonine/homoserine/homoserine lactone efflux protein
MSPELWLTYILACIVVVVVPGPIVTLVVANSMSHGTRAGFLNVLGAQIGNLVMLAVLVLGLATVIETAGIWFDWVRVLGALYLIWLGWRLLRATAPPEGTAPRARSDGRFVLQGFLVLMANPKALLFFGAFIPQFIDPAGDYVAQAVACGVVFSIVALVFDGGYAVLSGRARALLSQRRVLLTQKIGGLFMIAGGLWLATLRR